MHDDMEHIAKSVADVMMLSKASGGIGVSLTKLARNRFPAQIVQHAFHRGPTPFAKIIDTAIRAVSAAARKKARSVSTWRTGTSISPSFRLEAQCRRRLHAHAHRQHRRIHLRRIHEARRERRRLVHVRPERDAGSQRALRPGVQRSATPNTSKMAEAGKMRMFKKVPAREQYRQILVSFRPPRTRG